MARIWQCGFELNSVTDGVEITTNSTPVSIGTTNVRSGTYAGRVNAGAGFWRQVVFTSNQTTIGYIGVAVYIVAAPNANTQFIRWSTTGNVSVGNITMTTSRTLVLLKSDGTQIGSASAAIPLNTWTYVELKNDASSSPGALEGRVNGVSFASGANSNQGAWARALVGNVTGAQTTNDMWFDDWIINDSTGSFENTYPGASQKLIVLRPDSAGDANSFAVQIGGTAGSGNNFTRVNEVTPNDVTSYNGSLVLSQEDLFNCGACGLNSYDVIKNVSVGVRMANLVGADATAAFKLEIEKTASGTKTQSATIIPNSTTWISYITGGDVYLLNTYQDPNAASWTQATLDTMQIGYTLTATNVQTIAISNVWAYVSYTIGTPTGSNGNFLLFM